MRWDGSEKNERRKMCCIFPSSRRTLCRESSRSLPTFNSLASRDAISEQIKKEEREREMPFNGKVVAISNEPDSRVVVATFKDAKSKKECNELSLHGINVDQDVAAAFLELLRHEDRLWESVELINCRGQVEAAITMTMSIDRVKCFNLVRNIEMTVGYVALGTALQATTSLKFLRLTTSLQVSDASALADGLKKNKSLETLDFRWSSFDAAGITELARGLHENKSIKNLHFFGCGIDDEHVAELVTALRYHPSIEVLNFNANKCGTKGTLPIALMLQSTGCNLRKLDLSFQRIDAGEQKLDIPLLAAALSKNTSLKTLELSSNGLDDEDAQVLADAVCDNSSLQELFLARNKITDVGITALAERIPEMKGLKKLSLWGNSFGEEGAKELLAGLRCNTELEELDLFRQFQCSEQIIYFTYVNRGGRKILEKSPNAVPLSLWPLVLERANKVKLTKRRNHNDQQARVDILYCLLRGPVLFARGYDFVHPTGLSIGSTTA